MSNLLVQHSNEFAKESRLHEVLSPYGLLSQVRWSTEKAICNMKSNFKSWFLGKTYPSPVWSLLRKRPVIVSTISISNSRSLKRPGLIIETIESFF